MSTNDLVDFIKLSMMFPTDQSTMQYNDIVKLMNQELQNSAVPSIMETHEEYFIYKVTVPLITNIAVYPIPNRALGMVLRDLKYSDNRGNFFDMSRIAPEDKAFFQNNTGVNQVLSHYYVEGNNIVLTPQNNTNPTGYLNFFFFLRPNFLVRNDRVCTIENFVKDITITDYTAIQPGDTIQIVARNQTVDPDVLTLFAVNNSVQSITSNAVSTDDTNSIVTVTNAHNIASGANFEVTITGNTGSIPSINGTYQATSTGANTFSIPVNVTTGGTGGTYTITGQFKVETSNAVTATNLKNAALLLDLDASLLAAPNDNTVRIDYVNVSDTFETAQVTTNDVLTGIIDIDVDNVYIQFDQLPTTYTDIDTQVEETLFSDGCYVDFLQTLPGHRTYVYDVVLEEILSNNIGKVSATSLQTYQNNSSGGVLTYLPIIPGDYMALQNECIIPGIPPELHSALAERTCSRILMAIGDREGYAISQQKIADMNKNQTTMIGSRVEGSVPKVFNRNNLLRIGKRTVRRRFL